MLCAIEQYYKENCDGIWEHSYGFTIESYNNPGWLIKINDPLLFKVLDALNGRKEIPNYIKIRMGCTELYDVILFSDNLHSLSIFVNQLLT